MTSFGSVISMSNVNTQYTTAGTSGGFFSIAGTTCSLAITSLTLQTPRANNGYGGAFYLTNTQTTTMSLTSSYVYSSYAKLDGGFVKLAGTISTITISGTTMQFISTLGYGGIFRIDSSASTQVIV
jgi:hypothetical protein